MTDNHHPITPPPELVQQWLGTYFGTTVTGEVSDVELALATQAARWGADQELEACCKWLGDGRRENLSQVIALHAARRPKPPSLKEQALAALARLKSGALCADRVTDESIIRRAIESLPE